jgi:hypothetical protein
VENATRDNTYSKYKEHKQGENATRDNTSSKYEEHKQGENSTRYYTSPKYKEHKQGENAFICLHANIITPATSIQDRKN